MQKMYNRKSNKYRPFKLLIFLLIIFSAACSKSSTDPVEVIKIESDVYSYEVTCVACDIQFRDKDNDLKKVINNNGKWNYSIKSAKDAKLEIHILTTNKAYQNINAYILKNDDVIYGDLGYNSFQMLYNVASGQKSMTYGSYTIGSNVPAPAGGNNNPTSSVCGAKNKTGGYCKRVVSGGGRCWQHR